MTVWSRGRLYGLWMGVLAASGLVMVTGSWFGLVVFPLAYVGGMSLHNWRVGDAE